MSTRLRALNWAMRSLALPKLRRTKEPEDAARDFERLARLVFRTPPFVTQMTRSYDGADLHWVRLRSPRPRRVVLYCHGGGFMAGTPRTHAGMLARLSKLSRTEICAPRYRLLQEAPFPAAPEDVMAAWRALRAIGYRPEDIILGGDSAGGNLAFGLLARLLEMGERPRAIFAMSPWLDLTLSGASLADHAADDPFIPVDRMPETVSRYLVGAPATDPRASPLLAEFPAPPPALVQVGSKEVLYSDAARMCDHLRAQGGEARLDVWPDAPHVWQLFDGYVPQARMALGDIAEFITREFDRGCEN